MKTLIESQVSDKAVIAETFFEDGQVKKKSVKNDTKGSDGVLTKGEGPVPDVEWFDCRYRESGRVVRAYKIPTTKGKQAPPGVWYQRNGKGVWVDSKGKCHYAYTGRYMVHDEQFAGRAEEHAMPYEEHQFLAIFAPVDEVSGLGEWKKDPPTVEEVPDNVRCFITDKDRVVWWSLGREVRNHQPGHVTHWKPAENPLPASDRPPMVDDFWQHESGQLAKVLYVTDANVMLQAVLGKEVMLSREMFTSEFEYRPKITSFPDVTDPKPKSDHAEVQEASDHGRSESVQGVTAPRPAGTEPPNNGQAAVRDKHPRHAALFGTG